MCLGQPATQWDDRIFGSIGEVVAHQNPITVKVPATAFNRQNGGNLFCVSHPLCMATMFGADPNLEILSEFTNFDAGTELVQSQNMVPIPHCYMRFFITGPLTPRQVWEIVGTNITNHHNNIDCAPLLMFLLMACTMHAAGDTASPFTLPALTVPLADAMLVQHQTALIAH
jgi:hypothetical protein